MALFHIIIVSLIQGITEFLPISSSAHLILLPNLTGLADQGPLIDAAVHVGTLIAVVVFFKTESLLAMRGLRDLGRGQLTTGESHLALALIIATIPAVILGLILKLTGASDAMRDHVGLIGITMLGFGIVLWFADTKHPETRHSNSWTLKQAMILGLWQALALIPGTSRSGITITGARFLGFDRESAARISMLMSIPTILAAGTLQILDALPHATAQTLGDAALAVLFSCLAAFLALGLMMRLLKSVSFTPYVIYRIIFGAGLIWWAYS
jgi:undecaprenyl-diphosphatase